MISNFFKIAWRNLWKHKLFSFINIVGLGLAIPFALLSLIQVQSAFEFDNFHPYPERTFRIITDVTDNIGTKTKYALSPIALSNELQQGYPSVEKATFVVRDFGWEMNNRIKTIQLNSIYVEPSFFDMFGFPLLKGTRPVEPNTLVITQEKAEVFFGDSDPVGKILTHPDYGDFTITGVLKPFKRNTHFRSDVMLSMATYKRLKKDTLPNSLSAFTYVLLKEGANKKNLDAALVAVAGKMNRQPAFTSAKESFSFRKQNINKLAPDFEDLRGNSYIESLLDLSVNFGFALGLLFIS
ncbi:MAG: ABC transporter permease [Chitinophagaceae bacterium]|nr:ABC transporter permease [Chitinophagaceae bacterium]